MEILHFTTLLYILCLFSWALVATAEPNCNAPPLALSIRNVTLSNGFTRRGIEIAVGSQQEKFALSMNMAYNNTVLKLAPGFCPESETIKGCITRKGGIFDPTESSTWENGTLETFGGGDDTRRADRGIKAPAWRYGQDNLSLNDTSNSEVDLKAFPVTVLDDEDLSKSTLGLAPNSTMVKKLYEAGHIPSQAWSVYWGQTGTARNTFNDGTLVLGGIDKAKLANPDDGFYEEKFGNGEDDFNTCYLRVRVEQMVLRHPDGREWNLIQQRSQSGMLMCVVLDYELITVPGDIAQAYLDATGDSYLGREPGEYLWGMRIMGENAFPGTLTVKLTNGFSAEIPNHQLIHPARAISDAGEVVISNNTVKVVRLNALEGMNAPDLPLLGAPFLSQTYLVVDHDNHVMKFANAKPNTEQDLQSIISEKNSTQCSQTTDKPTPTSKPSATKKPQVSDSTGVSSSTPEPEQSPKPKLSVILGVIAGVLCFTAIVLLSVFYFLKRHRRRQQMQQQSIGLSNTKSHPRIMQNDDASGLQLNEDPTFNVLAGPYNQQLYYNHSSISEAPSSQVTAELHGQSHDHYGSQSRVFAELDATTRASFIERFKK